MLKAIFWLIFFISSSMPSWASEKNNQFCNQHTFTFMFLDVYDVKLCAENKDQFSFQSIYNNPFSLIINYRMNFDKQELSESSITQIKQYYSLSQKDQDHYYEKLLLIFPDVKKGDVIEARYKKNGHTEFYHNAQLTGSITNQKFSEIFLNIWLHKNNKYQAMVKDLFQKYE